MRGNDIYIKSRGLQGSFKVSVHPPGDQGPETAFYYGFDGSWLREHPGSVEPADLPRIERYRPRELGPGVRRIASIRVHPEAVASSRPVSKAQTHLWLNPPDPDLGVGIHVLLVERHDRARAWIEGRSISPVAGIVDEGSLGDLLIYVDYVEVGAPGVIAQGESEIGPVHAEDLEGLAFGIDSRDSSLVIDEVSFRVDYPQHRG